MTDLRTAAKAALEALEAGRDVDPIFAGETEDALRAALAQQAEPPGCDHCNHPLYAATRCRVCGRITEQAEPVAWVLPDLLPVFSFKTAQLWKRPFAEDQIPLYTAPPQRKPLTEEEIQAAWDSVDMRHPRGNETRIAFARAIERAHGIGGDDGQA